MAFVISVALLKGGVSKTTTALALGEAASLSVPVVILDTDPMGSARRWAELADAAGTPLRSRVERSAVEDVARRLHAVTRDAGLVIIDAPPPGALQLAQRAFEAADRVVMPVPPNLADLDRVQATMTIAGKYGKPARAVLTQVRGGIEDSAAAAITLRSWGVPVYDTQLPLTVAVQRAYGQPVTSGPLLRFGIDLMTEILGETR
jgi:chromosome partitioning protein